MAPFTLIDIKLDSSGMPLGYRALQVQFQDDQGRTLGYETVIKLGGSPEALCLKLHETADGLMRAFSKPAVSP